MTRVFVDTDVCLILPNNKLESLPHYPGYEHTQSPGQ